MNQTNKHAVISLSGGMDSSTLLLKLLSEGHQVTALSFDYGQKHKVELEKATELVEYLNNNHEKAIEKFGIFHVFHKIKHQIIKLDGLGQLLNSTLVEGGDEVPEGHYEAANMSLTVVPNRNKIFSSIIQAVALSIAEKHNTTCYIALGIHAGDHHIYRDCRQEFRDADYKAFLEGNENGNLVQYHTPYLHFDKAGILKDGEACCSQLGLDFNEVYKRTNTSYKPLQIEDRWYSDYKSASSVERIEAFIKLGKKDPVSYAETIPSGEIIPRTWEEVLIHVKPVLEKQNLVNS
jgi:7-cyano-7-deazaguanine synthase